MLNWNEILYTFYMQKNCSMGCESIVVTNISCWLSSSPSKSQNKIVANKIPLNIHWIKTLFDNSFSYTCSLKIHNKSDYLDVQYVIFLFDIFWYKCFLINFLKKGHYIILFTKLPWYTVTYVYKSVWYLSKTINKWKMN